MKTKSSVFPIVLTLILLSSMASSYEDPSGMIQDADPVLTQSQIVPNPIDINEFISDPLVELITGTSYASSDYYTIAKELASRFPKIISYDVIGHSKDGKEIFSIIMTKDVQNSISRNDFNTFRMHYYIDAGVHGRETVNPAILLKQIEDYAFDYYMDSHISGFNLQNILNRSVLHFVPLVNPDGHDLAKFGIKSIETPSIKEALLSLGNLDYSQWKSNIAGVDINKNFPDFHLNRQTQELEDKWQQYPGKSISEKPSGEYYPGEYPGSEPETKAIMEYMDKYDFRNYVSYHSRGNVVYYDYLWYPDEYRNEALKMAKLTKSITGYKLLDDTGKGSGYSTSYYVALSLKPSLTVETLPYSTVLPSDNKTYSEAYKKTWLLPLYYEDLGNESGYYPYRLYVDNQYIRDFPNKEYADAVAKSTGGIIVESSGVPKYILD